MSGERISSRQLAPMAVAALGVVFGDIGTSPLYAMSACFTGPGIEVTPEHILGVLSLIFWTLLVVILLKYVMVVLNADNKGEGGVLALTALVINTSRESPRRKWYAMLGILGASLFFADGAITPTITVLSAVEGLQVAAPGSHIPTVPIALAVLIGFFIIQRHGTGSVGKVFGPIMLGWFLILAVMGVSWIVREPQVFLALDPLRALRMLTEHKVGSLAVLAGVFLTVTGGEALYADMGHFGKAPIRLGWICIVMPALVLNYFGQGAMLIENPAAISNPFYLMAPDWSVLPLVGIATAASVIASQAVISGVFSVTTQAVSLGLLPRLRVEHSSAQHAGQIYVPTMNWILMIAALALVVGFGSSAALAGAYGLAVSGAMTIVTPLTLSLIKSRTGKDSRMLRTGLSLLFIVDIAFLLANLTKLEDGGWLPLVSGLIIFWLMQTWQSGRASVMARLLREQKPVRDFIEDLKRDPPVRVPGTSIFLDQKASGIPRALLNNIKFNRVMHERVVLLTVVTREVPRVAAAKRLTVTPVCEGIVRVVAQVGFMEKPNITAILREAESHGVAYDPELTTFFLSREELLPGRRSDLPPLRRRAFMQMARGAQVIADYYGLPPNRVVEIGTRLEI
ncbi:MAG: system potassium uptake protein [Gammaproteobacteria bacterium]|jgi:KUP system potassium uptake protein|nr:system potassium uptake protein [Gammaproteobacteria bacterium]HMI75344.1 KUP/HAK/KT family potassium transporter [Steroidobacteraceae bacterium]